MKKSTKILIVIVILAICFRLWLLASNNWKLIINSYYDSHLQINEAISLLRGHWLGEYSKFTLCKNISYPLFLFVLNILHIPYYYGFGALIILASTLFIKSIKPICSNRIIQCIIFIFLIFNPVGFSKESLYHYRNSIIPWVVLIVISSIIGIYLRRDRKAKDILPYGIIGMIGTGFYWLLREDSIWFLPFILTGYVFTVISFIISKYKTKDIIKKSLVSFFPTLGIILSVLFISTINYFVYGIFTTNDRTSTYEAKVLGQLVLIDDGTDLEKDVWVSSKAIKLAAKASPTFAKLDLTQFDAWPKEGDLSIWALRDAADNAGYYKDAKKTNDMFKKAYTELKEGFKTGKLKKKKAIKLSDTSGVFSKKEFVRPLPIMIQSLYNHATYKLDQVDDMETVGIEDEASLKKYEAVLRINLLRSEELLTSDNSDVRRINENDNLKRSLKVNKTISNSIIFVYRITGLIILAISLIIYIWYLIKSIKDKKESKEYSGVILIMTGIILTVFMNSYLVGLWGVGFKLTANDGLFASYTTAQSIMIPIFEILAIIIFLRQNKNKIVKKHRQC